MRTSNVSAVSLKAGEVYVHVQPLLPTQLDRNHAVRLIKQNQYDVLELVNYEGPARTFSCLDMQRMLNGLVLTVSETGKYDSLQSFHDQYSQARVVDYLFVGNRYVEYLRDDCWFRVIASTTAPGVMTEMVDGETCPQPMFLTNMIETEQLPFINERCQPIDPFFPWDQMEISNWRNSWLIGSRGLPGERPYSDTKSGFYALEDGPQ